MTFFDKQTEDLDIPTIKKHAARPAEAGLVGLPFISHAKRKPQSQGLLEKRSTKPASETLSSLLVPQRTASASPFKPLKTQRKLVQRPLSSCRPLTTALRALKKLIFEFYTAVAEASPIPIIIYNYPGAVSGVDLDSDLVIRLVEATKGKVFGTKFTDANTGKLTRLSYHTDALSVKSQGSGWLSLGGIADFTLQTAISGGSGVIAGGVNVLPKLCVKVWNRCAQGKWDEAAELQKVLSKADWVLTKAANAGTKAAIELGYGYGGYPRRPLQRLCEDEYKQIKQGISEAMKIERSL